EEMHEWFKNSTAELKKATDEGLISLERSKELSECTPSEQRGVVEQVREILANAPSKKEAKDEARAIVDKATGRPAKPSPVVAFTPKATITVTDAPENGNGSTAVSNGKAEVKPRGSIRSASGLRQIVVTLEEKIDECHKSFDDESLEDLDRQRIGEDLARFQGIQEALLYVLGDLNEVNI
ncbi:MAG: hypothetical protein KC964_22455, partial [Candidatus Omnitrophica bacterium]|nr:hypothetical protein [Candidatus Omnitrophota bacterium]